MEPAISNVMPDPRGDVFISRLTAVLVERGHIDERAAARALTASRQSHERFDLALTRLGIVKEDVLVDTLAELLGIARVNVSDWPEMAVSGIDVRPSFLKAAKMSPIAEVDGRIVVASADPFNRDAVKSLSFMLERPVETRLAVSSDVDACIERLYCERASHGPALGEPVVCGEAASEDDVRRLEDMASEAPVVRLVQSLVERAVAAHASDIHIEPRDDGARVRFRIDGILHTVETLPPSMRTALSSRVKIMAQLNIAERRLPQDGRIRLNVRGHEIDLRVSTMPAMGGESVVLRVLDRSSVALSFDDLGFDAAAVESIGTILSQPNGIILVTGPTGSGKTTTLYTALSTLNNSERKLFTVEDPIEYRLEGVNQVQVSPKIGLSFATALRSILRQDPDIVMVGEIRDLETAEIAVRASLTGHLVLSTVHTNGAAATITRLLDMGVEDYLMASSLKAVIAQRLVRRLCGSCARPINASRSYIERLSVLAGGTLPAAMLASPRIAEPVGCPECRHTGFSGRSVIYEMMTVGPQGREAILNRGNERLIEEAARSDGMVPMIANGISKVLAGETSLEEVLRVTRAEHATIPL